MVTGVNLQLMAKQSRVTTDMRALEPPEMGDEMISPSADTFIHLNIYRIHRIEWSYTHK